MSSSRISLAFDLYGTLLDTSSVAKRLAEHLPGDANVAGITAEWRKYQLEYSWRIAAMGRYENFETLTRQSLVHATNEAGYHLDSSGVEDIIAAYDRLDAFPDVYPALDKLRALPDVSCLVFSNGTEKVRDSLPLTLTSGSSMPPMRATRICDTRKEVVDQLLVLAINMVGNSIKNVAGITSFGNKTLGQLSYVVVDDVKSYKPFPKVYEYLAEKLGKGATGDRKTIWLISGNPFDVVGARNAGLNAIWVDRAGKGWMDQLGTPSHIVNSLEDVVGIVSRL